MKLRGLERTIADILVSGEKSGREIADLVGHRSVPYGALHVMEGKGFIESRWGEERPPERGGCRRKYYSLVGDD